MKIFVLLACVVGLAACRGSDDGRLDAGADGASAAQDGSTAVQAPSVDAGPDVALRLPTSSLTLHATASDYESAALRYEWRKDSGGLATLSGNTTDTLTVTSLAAGVYVFSITVTDDLGASASDSVQVTVTAANAPPTVSAGPDINLVSPASSTSFTALGSDSDGTIASYAWTQLSGTTAILSGDTTPTLSVSGLTIGSRQFQVTVTDNEGAVGSDVVAINVTAAPDQPPVVNAGLDQSIRLPSSSVQFHAVASDPDGTIASYQWTEVSGGPATLTGDSTADLSVANLAAGTYVFKVRVTDNQGASASDTVGITVQAANVPPNVNAGPDKALMLPANSIVLNGSANDSDGTVMTYAWTEQSGPSATLTGQNTATLSLSNLLEGTYLFRLTATDNDGGSAFDEAQVVVSAAGNHPPVVNAGADQTLSLPTNSTTLTGTASDPDGDPLTYAWTQTAGGTATIATPTAASTQVSGLAFGTYAFQLKVSDGKGGTAQDTVQVVVAATSSYFVSSSSGNDANNGTSISTPWKTISKVNSSTFSSGATVLFKRGDTWRETLSASSSGAAGNPVTYSAYGTGANPVITGSDLIGSWSANSSNVWKASVATQPNIVYFDGVRGTHVASAAAVSAAYNWFWASGVLYVYAPGNANPATTYSAPGIEAGSRISTLLTNNKSNVTFDNLTLRDGNGINWDKPSVLIGPTTVQGVIVQNCTIERNKTTAIDARGTTTAASLTVDHCTINDNGAFGVLIEPVYVTAQVSNSIISSNGWASLELNQQISGIQGFICNVHIFGNAIYNSAPGVANANDKSHGIYGGDCSGVADIHDNTVYGNPNGAGIKTHSSADIYNNTCYGNRLEGIELGWNAAVNAVYNVHNNFIYASANGFSGLYEGSKGTGTITLIVENNTFYKSAASGSELGIEDDLEALTVKNNIFWAAPGRVGISLATQQTGTVSIDYNLYWRDDGGGDGTDTHRVHANPLLVNPPIDFHLQAGSPAIDKGTNVGLPYSGAFPDIGGYEH